MMRKFFQLRSLVKKSQREPTLNGCKIKLFSLAPMPPMQLSTGSVVKKVQKPFSFCNAKTSICHKTGTTAFQEMLLLPASKKVFITWENLKQHISSTSIFQISPQSVLWASALAVSHLVPLPKKVIESTRNPILSTKLLFDSKLHHFEKLET